MLRFINEHIVIISNDCRITYIFTINVFTGLKLVSIDPATEQVVVETTLAADVVQSVLEQTGSRAVLQGVGTAQGQWQTCQVRTGQTR